MKTKIVKFLSCPICQQSFTKIQGKEKKGEIKAGELVCAKRHSFSIKNFIPRFILTETTTKQKQVKKSFSAKWAMWQQFNPWFKQFFDDWFMKKIGITNKAEFANYFAKKKTMLDAGTGLGTKVETMCRLSPGEVFGVDIAEGGVENAFRNTRKFSNAHIIQADLFHPPFRKGIFDFIVSDGVLHHTPDTRRAFLSLVPFLAKNGDIAIHVYKKMGPIREFTDNLLRDYATKLSPEKAYKFCEPFTKLGKSLDEMNLEINVPEDIPSLDIKAGKYPLQRFIYYTMFQCFWNPNLSFRDNNLVNYDWFHPQFAWRHTPEEVRNWFKKAKLKKIRRFITNESGVSMMAKK
jgi:SAM-dependent methyltransferase